ncbi:MAG: DNA mismatch repair protein MutS [Geminicoccaceae bacterium]
MAVRRPRAVETDTRAGERASPMIEQYQGLKAAHPGSLLFFRMGDFYELFFADAEAAAPALDIALTKRGQHAGRDIPMCGVPVHSAESYLERLIRAGFKVAICEQVEDPALARQRGGKSVVRREVVRIVTPGTLTEESLLDARRHNFLGALARVGGALGFAWVDISTGAFRTEATAQDDLGPLLARLAPGEILLARPLAEDAAFHAALQPWRDRLTVLEPPAFDSQSAALRLQQQFAVATLDAFGRFERAEIAAAGAILDYLATTQKGLLPRLDRPERQESAASLRIDPATRRNLELLETQDGRRQGALLATIDRTRTGAGARLLAERLAAPLATLVPIQARLAEVAGFVADEAAREDCRTVLKGVPDIARALSRLVVGRGGPRDLVALATGLAAAHGLRDRLRPAEAALAALAEGIADTQGLVLRLEQLLEPAPPLQARDGGFIRADAVAELDELRTLRDQGRRHIAALEARYRETTGIASLKIRHNNMLGYFIEVTATHAQKVPDDFRRRQGMVNAQRFGTDELADLERRIASAADRALALELELFEELRGEVLEAADPIARTAGALAAIDVAAALAALAIEADWTAPVLTDGLDFSVEGGRHPVVEAALQAGRGRFVANDCRLEDAERLWLLTGPNMAGKSTFLRQNALIVVLAQMGSFVPARSARLGVVDKLFSRVGAADDLARGQSTFMVEMVETATILNQAGERSFVILDEIGRGTATYDGLSLAWAVVEHLHEANRCRGLFATHYHELTALAARLEALGAYTVRVKEWQGDVVFLHEVMAGTADRSYGLHVARLAGLPHAVLARAQEVLEKLEAGEARAAPAEIAEDLPLFRASLRNRPAAPPPAAIPPHLVALADRLAAVRPDDLSPRAALELLYELEAIARET